MTGFFVITINIPDKIETQDITYKKYTLKPENILNVSNKYIIITFILPFTLYKG